MNNYSPLAQIRVRYLLLGCFVYFLVATALLISVSPGSPEVASWILIIGVGLYLVPLMWLLRQVRRCGLEPQALIGDTARWSRSWHLVFLAIPLQLGFHGANWLFGTLLSYITTPASGTSGSDLASSFKAGWLYPVWLIFVVAFGPLIEELLFRGVIFNRWAYKWGVRRGVVFSSLLFGFAHRGFVWGFAVGVVLCLVYTSTRTLVVPILCHVTVNALSEIGDLLQSSATVSSFASNQVVLLATSFLFGVVPVSIFIVRHWPEPEAPIPYSA